MIHKIVGLKFIEISSYKTKLKPKSWATSSSDNVKEWKLSDVDLNC